MNSGIIFKNGLFRVRKIIKQSNLLFISDSVKSINVGINSVENHRLSLEKFFIHNPKYQYYLKPVRIPKDAPEIVKKANFAAEIANVGLMAAVPGALAELAVEDMKTNTGSSVNLVENGGEIQGVSDRSLNIGIYSGNSLSSNKIGFKLLKENFPIGIGTSSARIGHAISFGQAELTIIFANKASIADAVATTVCNEVKGDDIEGSVQLGLEKVKTIPYIIAAMVIREGFVGKVGKLPQFIKFNGNIKDYFEASLHKIFSYKLEII